jgi:hypothetical protein
MTASESLDVGVMMGAEMSAFVKLCEVTWTVIEALKAVRSAVSSGSNQVI